MRPGALEELKQDQERRLSNSSFYYRCKPNPTFLPVALTGGVGDAILSRLTLDLLRDAASQPMIWSAHADAVNYFGGDRILPGPIPEFTWYLKLDPMPKFIFSEDFSGFLVPEHRQLFEGHTSWLQDNGLLGHTVRTHSDQKWLQAEISGRLGLTAETLPPVSLGLGKHSPLRASKRAEPGDYITIHDGVDAQNQLAISGRSTKQWNWRHWNQTVIFIKKEYPHLRIKQLGTRLGRPIDGVDELLLGETTLVQAFEILSKSLLHIDTDSGLAHAATKLGVPCIVLFGPTPRDFYGHLENINLSSRKNCPGNCFWITPKWMDRCPIGYPAPQCMNDISADDVIQAVVGILNRKAPELGASGALSGVFMDKQSS